jgi:hypothetical protein
MEDIGCSCCASVPVLKDLLQQFPKLKEQDIALMLGTMARMHTTDGINMGPSNSQWGGMEDGTVLPLYTSFSSPHDDGKESKELKSWDATVFVDTIKELVCFSVFCCKNVFEVDVYLGGYSKQKIITLHFCQYPKLNWATVIKHLDHPGFLLTDQKGLALIASIYRKASKDPFPLVRLYSFPTTLHTHLI